MIARVRKTVSETREQTARAREELVRLNRSHALQILEHKLSRLGKRRTLFVGPKSQQILEKYLDRDLGDYLFSPRESERLRLAALREKRKSKVQPSQVSRARAKRVEKLRPFYSLKALFRGSQ